MRAWYFPPTNTNLLIILYARMKDQMENLPIDPHVNFITTLPVFQPFSSHPPITTIIIHICY